ncbi:Helix-turn-helix domain-containing protein [Paraburkholderia kururiensis]|jgi:transcriptional regulator GlxA family with amidase domain|uniref:GlxA family transcriptional regulator n=2 Tax=Burkholderiaceae TaxID=119060 RepID=UPI00034AC54A|nr:helix-turn-helix domain-containing protein [Paraburkholderia kururiensis]
MECIVNVQVNRAAPASVMPETRITKRIGIALFNGFALPGAATIVEVFQAANDFTSSQRGGTRYEVCLLSASGGRIASSSSVFVWTESVEAHRLTDPFHTLFIVGGVGVSHALRDERLITWLRRAYPRSESIVPIGEGRLLLEAAGIAQTAGNDSHGERMGELTRNAPGNRILSECVNPLRRALAVVQEDHGSDVARQIGNWVAPPAETQFTAIVRKNASICISEQIQASARWIEANGDRQVSIDDAAQVAAMSERNFLRRFKMEMGVTPSEYLLYVRLDMSCRLLTETNLPVDKIARRCGIGSGGRLSKLFRKHLGSTPTEYRATRRPAVKTM